MYLAAGGYQIVIYCYNGQTFATAVGSISFTLSPFLLLLIFYVIFIILYLRASAFQRHSMIVCGMRNAGNFVNSSE